MTEKYITNGDLGRILNARAMQEGDEVYFNREVSEKVKNDLTRKYLDGELTTIEEMTGFMNECELVIDDYDFVIKVIYPSDDLEELEDPEDPENFKELYELENLEKLEESEELEDRGTFMELIVDDDEVVAQYHHYEGITQEVRGQNMAAVNVIGSTVAEAVEILEKAGVKYVITPEKTKEEKRMDISLYLRVNEKKEVLEARTMPSDDGIYYGASISTSMTLDAVKELAKEGLALQDFLKEVNK